jgi:hypothetical protein
MSNGINDGLDDITPPRNHLAIDGVEKIDDTKVSITLDFDRQVTPDGAGILDLIIAGAAHQILNRYAIDPEGNEVHVGGSRLEQRISKIVTDTMEERVKRAIDKVVPEIMERLINQGIPKGSKYDPEAGQHVPQFEPLADFITKRVDMQLKTHDRSGRSSSFSPDKTILEKTLEDAVDRALGKELKSAVDQARSTVLQAVKTKAAEVLTETIERMATRL